jgi:hypothetical protein
VINFDHLYIGGGNAKKVTIALPSHATIISNTAGLLGGIALWTNGHGIISATQSQKLKLTTLPSRPVKKAKGLA